MQVSGKRIQKIMLFSLITLIIAYMIPVFFYNSISGLACYSTNMLDSAMTVQIQHPDGSTDSYDSNIFPVVNRGDILTAEIKLPDTVPYQNPAICFHVYNSMITLSCDNKIFYDYGSSLVRCGHLIGGIYTSATLPADSLGKKIILRCEVQEDHAFSTLYNFTIMPASEAARACLLGHMSDFIFLISISFFSIFASILIFIFRISTGKMTLFRQGLLLTFLCNSISGYLLAYYALFNVLCPNLRVNANLEYIMLFLLPVPFTAYYLETAVHTVTKIIMRIMNTIFSIFFLIATLLNYFTTKYHYSNYVGIITAMMLICCTVTAFLYLRYGHDVADSIHEMLNRYTQITMLFVVLTTLISFNIHKYILSGHSVLDSYVLPISFIYLMLMLIGSFLFDIYDDYKKARERKLLEHLAYTDCMTGLSNRQVFENALDDLKKNPGEPFTLIFYDLNHLKLANDKYGHDMGDLYLQKAAEFISASCPGASACCRIGGDEFVTIFRGRSSRLASASIQKLDSLILQFNRSGTFPFSFSVAYGTAKSTYDVPLSPDEALKAADHEMYLNKQMKEQ